MELTKFDRVCLSCPLSRYAATKKGLETKFDRWIQRQYDAMWAKFKTKAKRETECERKGKPK